MSKKTGNEGTSAISLSPAQRSFMTGLGLIGLCIVINIVGAQFALACRLPMFLDVVGTAAAGALGGYIPGVIVGFCTNLINGLSDTTTFYYGIINILIAFAAAGFSRRHAFESFRGIIMVILSFSVIGGGIGSVLTWNLYGGGFGEGISAGLAHYLYDHSIHSIFFAQLTADIIIDIFDKTVTVLLVALMLKLLPSWIFDLCNFYGWRDEEIEKEDIREKLSHKGLSIQTKIVLTIAMSTIVIALSVTVISMLHYHHTLLDERESFGTDVAKLVAEQIDPDKVDTWLEEGEDSEGYRETKAQIQKIFDTSSNVDYIYVYRILEDGCHVVFDMDTADVKGDTVGTVIPFDEGFSEHIPALLKGEEIDPIVTDDTFGWLLTIYIPVYDKNHVCTCYAAADISMQRIAAAERIFLTKIVSLFSAALVMLMVLGLTFAKMSIIHPINSMAEAANAFAFTDAETREETIESIVNLNIRTGDEVEYLYRALIKTTEDTAEFIADAQEKSQTISDLQNGLIYVMADLVESRDQCTGDHIKKTSAYVRVIVEQMKEEGIYADAITEEYIDDLENSAPMHDIGKIRISDVILNKPGKLTDEEYNTMKLHTLYGAEAIDNAMSKIDSKQTGYMKEARHMALGHHEKWNGTGYPYGLKGEDIPLSARVMAVADVFDALVSRRSYKNRMSFEEAMGIIIKDSGSHFDPNIVKAFVHAEDKVRRIAQENMEKEIRQEETDGKA